MMPYIRGVDAWHRLLGEAEGFEWDAGNDRKNSEKHGVLCQEAEQVFGNQPLFLLGDPLHSKSEMRIRAFGKTDEGRLLAVTFTLRKKRIRVISARDMHRKERKHYEQD